MNPKEIILWINRIEINSIYIGDKALVWCHNEVYSGFLDLPVQRVWVSQKFFWFFWHTKINNVNGDMIILGE